MSIRLVTIDEAFDVYHREGFSWPASQEYALRWWTNRYMNLKNIRSEIKRIQGGKH
ncbi:MAG: hypothetical protein RDU76_11440 [Candidatus Edwardsbacteria bacterium]|nr:hypothetical protein [Candidatus Edwardsbacteria bacterium]